MVAETRRRILAAAMDLHAVQGVQGTSYEEIARRAGVAPATVYRHFPSLDDLVPACARSIQVLQPATPALIASLFQGLRRPAQRLEWLVRGTCQCYERDQGWLHAARREGDLVPALGEVVRVQDETLRTLVRAALDGSGADERTVRVVAALVGFPFWKSLRDAGLSAAEAEEQILELARDQLARIGVDY
jgi:AcrR family transcriptional regulator